MTTLVRNISARPAGTAQSELTRVFNSFFDSATPLAGPLVPAAHSFSPALDVIEQEEEYILSADLPGLRESDVKIEILGDVLTISGERKLDREGAAEGYRRIERASGSFTRQLNLPKGVDAGMVRASFEHGVLEIHIPKPAQAKPRRVEISTAA